MGRLFKLAFLALNLQNPETLSHGLVIGSTGSHSSSTLLSSTSLIYVQASPRAKVSRSFFFSVVFFSGGLPFALYLVRLELLSSSPF
jgi:hypothetical protein